MKYKNCWEAKECGLGPGCGNSSKISVCPAALPGEYDGINRGEFGGRFCWAVHGTYCGGQVQGAYATKLKSCLDCDFLQKVNAEEGRDFKLIPPKN